MSSCACVCLLPAYVYSLPITAPPPPLEVDASLNTWRAWLAACWEGRGSGPRTHLPTFFALPHTAPHAPLQQAALDDVVAGSSALHTGFPAAVAAVAERINALLNLGVRVNPVCLHAPACAWECASVRVCMRTRVHQRVYFVLLCVRPPLLHACTALRACVNLCCSQALNYVAVIKACKKRNRHLKVRAEMHVCQSQDTER